MNIIWFFKYEECIRISDDSAGIIMPGVDSIEKLTIYPIHPGAWREYNIHRYNRACFEYTKIIHLRQ